LEKRHFAPHSKRNKGIHHPGKQEIHISNGRQKWKKSHGKQNQKKTSIYVSPSSGSQICYRFGFQQMSIRIGEEEEDSSSKAHLK
jgi:hypothetical protein